MLNDKGQYLFYGRVAGCLITGNEDGIKHCAQNVLYSLQHVGYTIPPNADAGWIGEAGPGPSYLDPGSGGPENDFTNRNTTFMTWNLMHLAKMLKDAGRRARLRQPALGVERRRPASTGRTRSTADPRTSHSHPVWMMPRAAAVATMAVSTPSGCCPPRKVAPCRSGTSSGSSSSSSRSRPTSWCCSRSWPTCSATPEVSGGMKAVWVVCLVFFTFITAIVYLIVRGRGMNERSAKKYAEARQAQEDYVRSVAGASSTSAPEQIAKAKELLDAGTITADEFAALKAKALA